MKIKTVISQNRRDFMAIYECEHCKYDIEKYGYDDLNFHQNVIPNIVCPSCGQKADSNYRALTPKYPKDMVV